MTALVLAIVLIVWIAYLAIRANWVHNRGIEVINRCHANVNNFIREFERKVDAVQEPEEKLRMLKEYDLEDLGARWQPYHDMASANAMLLKFWIWDIKGFIRPEHHRELGLI
jgi:hypothetical protein